MDELLQVVAKNITSIKSTIERNKKYFNYPFTTKCDNYYSLILLQNRLDPWERFKLYYVLKIAIVLLQTKKAIYLREKLLLKSLVFLVLSRQEHNQKC
jgi:aromatic ring hydroxylase